MYSIELILPFSNHPDTSMPLYLSFSRSLATLPMNSQRPSVQTSLKAIVRYGVEPAGCKVPGAPLPGDRGASQPRLAGLRMPCPVRSRCPLYTPVRQARSSPRPPSPLAILHVLPDDRLRQILVDNPLYNRQSHHIVQVVRPGGRHHQGGSSRIF